MEQQAEIAAQAMENYRNNKIIMEFVTKEALEKVASEIRKAMGGGTTAKAVELLSIKHKNIADRVEEYINVGLLACYFAALKKKAA